MNCVFQKRTISIHLVQFENFLQYECIILYGNFEKQNCAGLGLHFISRNLLVW